MPCSLGKAHGAVQARKWVGYIRSALWVEKSMWGVQLVRDGAQGTKEVPYGSRKAYENDMGRKGMCEGSSAGKSG